MTSDVAYWTPPDENPNFVSRPPDPGLTDLFKTIGWDALYHSPFYATERFSALTIDKNIPWTAFPQRKMDVDELNEKYGLGGQLKFDEPMYENAAQTMYQRKIDENDRSYIIASGQTTGMRKTASFGVGMASTLLDPINFAAMFIPVAGEARIARFASQFKTTLGQRIAAGALTGLSGTAMVEPFILLPALQEQANYGLKDSALNLGFGAALGGFLHAGLGAVADRIRGLKPKDSDALFESAMNNVLKDEPVTSPAKVAEFTDEANSNPERVTRAAVQMNDGTIKTGSTHGAIVTPMTEAEIAQVREDGWLTDRGRFVSRDEAAQLARDSGQLAPDADTSAGLRHSDVISSPDFQARANQDPGIMGIPLRDANGRFLSKEKRLELLNQKLQDEKIQQPKQDNGVSNVIKDTKEISSSLPKNDLGTPTDHAKDISLIDEHTEELKKSLDVTPEKLDQINSEIKESTGDQPGRETGIVEGIKCMIRNLI